jgi:hypothetical protein
MFEDAAGKISLKATVTIVKVLPVNVNVNAGRTLR